MLERFSRALKMISMIRNEYWGLLHLQQVTSADAFLAPYTSRTRGLTKAVSLDLGSGPNPANPFGAEQVFGVDIRCESAMIKVADLSLQPIPYPSDHFDYITAHDFLEHVPRVIHAPSLRFPFVTLMNEVWRCLKVGGVFFARTPIYPFSAAFRDPTHVNIFSHDTFSYYFSQQSSTASIYGFTGGFELLAQGIKPPYLFCVMRKPATASHPSK